jgi:hypothetical protein
MTIADKQFPLSFIKIGHQPMGRQVCLTMPMGELKWPEGQLGDAGLMSDD